MRKIALIFYTIPFLFLASCSQTDITKYDIVILNARVAVGEEPRLEKLNLGINADTIAAITNTSRLEGREEIDARGLIVSPGFIDIHTHCDFQIGEEERKGNLNYLMQGVTSVVTGNCGYGTYAISNMAEAYEENGIGTNVIPMTGFGALRTRVMGKDKRDATPGELDKMKSLLAKAMQEGSWGLTTGLQYVPEKYAGTDEVIALAKVLPEYGGFYNTHMRSEEEQLFEAVEESIEICKEAGIPLNIAHLKANGRNNWDQMPAVMELVEAEQSKGMTITADMYPYDKSASTTLSSVILIPPEYETVVNIRKSLWNETDEEKSDELMEMFYREFSKLLADPESRENIKQYTEKGVSGQVNWVAKGGWNYFSVVYAPGKPELENRMIIELAEESGRTPFDIAADLIISEGPDVWISLSTMKEENLRKQLVKPWVMLSSDGSAVDHHSEGVHPRNYGSQARLLNKYVKQEKLITLEEAICKLSILPAKTVGLENRGMIKEGYYADIVLFDFETLEDKATFVDPHQYPSGIEFIILNGDVVVEDGEFMQKYSGRVILKNK